MLNTKANIFSKDKQKSNGHRIQSWSDRDIIEEVPR